MAEDVGYPPYIKDDAELDRHYSMVGESYGMTVKASTSQFPGIS